MLFQLHLSDFGMKDLSSGEWEAERVLPTSFITKMHQGAKHRLRATNERRKGRRLQGHRSNQDRGESGKSDVNQHAGVCRDEK